MYPHMLNNAALQIANEVRLRIANEVRLRIANEVRPHASVHLTALSAAGRVAQAPDLVQLDSYKLF